MLIERRARAQERRFVPETIARFLREASEFVPLTFKPVPSLLHAFEPARTPSVLRRYEKDADWKLQDRHILSTISSEPAEPVFLDRARARPGALKRALTGPGVAFAGSTGSRTRSSCSNSLPRCATRATRATEDRRIFVSAAIRSERSRKTRPGLCSVPGSADDWLARASVSIAI
jgi:hypothetical protein